MKNLLWCSVHTPTNEQELELLPSGRLIFLQNLNPSLLKQIEENPDDDLKIMSLVIKMLEIDCEIYRCLEDIIVDEEKDQQKIKNGEETMATSFR